MIVQGLRCEAIAATGISLPVPENRLQANDLNRACTARREGGDAWPNHAVGYFTYYKLPQVSGQAVEKALKRNSLPCGKLQPSAPF